MHDDTKLAAHGIEPSHTGGLSDTIYAQLKAAILSQKILPSTALQETELGAQFNVSRTPVREALHDLLNEGLVRRHGRFYQVVEMSTDEIRHLYEVREALERMAVQLSIERATDASINSLYDIIDDQTKALAEQDIPKLTQLDSDFHLTIAKMTGNLFLYKQLASVHDKVMLARSQIASTTSTWSHGVIVEHERILSALTRRDIAVADAEMRYHLNSVIRLHLGLKQEPRSSQA